MAQTLGIYIHIPFCVRKCRYCDFLSAPSDEETRQRYTDSLVREIRSWADVPGLPRVDTVFIGGGTPSVMDGKLLARIMEAVRETFRVREDAEISMEMNPGACEDSVYDFISGYLNRVSIGLQSSVGGELRFLGRIHSKDDFLRTYRRVRRCGLRNVNIDLMSGIPWQTVATWRDTLNFAAGVGPEHISAYSLIVEEGTEFGRMKARGQLTLPDEETEREMYYTTQERLNFFGFSRYEISNYARPGFECRHNVRYWVRKPYLGFGLGAASFYGHRRWRNTGDLERYLGVDFGADPGNWIPAAEEITPLSRQDEMEEFMFLGLRMMRGVSGERFQDAFGVSLESVYRNPLKRLERDGLISRGAGNVRLTARGIDVSNRVLAEFLLDDKEAPPSQGGIAKM